MGIGSSYPFFLLGLLLMLMVFGRGAAWGQGVKPRGVYADSRYQEYDMRNGIRYGVRAVYRQTLTDRQGRAHTVVYYSPKYPRAEDYEWNFFVDTVRVRSERYLAGKLLYRKLIHHDAKGRIRSVEYFEPDGGDTVLVQRTTYSYDGRGRVVKREGRNAEGGRVFRSKIGYYDTTSYPVRIRTRGCDPYDTLWVSSLKRKVLEADSVGRPLRVREQREDLRGSSEGIYRFAYDAKGRLSERHELDADSGVETGRYAYSYYVKSGYPRNVYYYGPDGKLLRLWRHERMLFPSGRLNQPVPEEF